VNLRESLNNPDHGDGWKDPVSGREDFLWAGAFVHGWSEARGLRFAISTDGPTMRLHNLDADTRSANIVRNARTTRDVAVAIRAQLDALPFWGPEEDTWGPDPWHGGQSVRRVS
jgi:hypothetical protein